MKLKNMRVAKSQDITQVFEHDASNLSIIMREKNKSKDYEV